MIEVAMHELYNKSEEFGIFKINFGGKNTMAKNDNAHSIRLVDSLSRNIGNEAAKEFEEKYSLSKSADIDKKFEWAKAVCNFLEEYFDTDTIVKIRKECRCNDGKSIANKLLKYLNRADDIEQFVELFNKNETFALLEYISDNKILFGYPQCYCACVKRIPQELSKTWCYCTLGNAEGIFREVFKKDVKVTLLQSIKTGADKCVIEIEW